MQASDFHSLLDWSISIEKSAASLIGTPLYVVSYLFLAAFKILSLSWNFAILIMLCLAVGLFGFLLMGTLCFLDLCNFFSQNLGSFQSLGIETGFQSLVLLLLVSLLYSITPFHVLLQFPLHLFILF